MLTVYEGVLPLWKEAGMTSHDCVARARRLLRMKRIGHTGTLDPEVSGVLPLCLGRATRIVEYVQELPKTYEAELTLGFATNTEDVTGEIIEKIDSVQVTEREVREAIAAFEGEIEQTPPMYSAVKVEGKRLYELARTGKEVERPSRKVTIYSIHITQMCLAKPHPQIRITVTCSKGTYIRTLCTDIGKALGVPAVMSALVRTASGPIQREDCITFAEAERLLASDDLSSRIIAVGDALPQFPKGHLSDAAVLPALQGKKIYAGAVRLDTGHPADRLYRLYGNDPAEPGKRFIGVYRFDSAMDVYVPVKLFT